MNILFVDNRSCGWQSVACYGHKKTGGNQGGLLMCGGGGGGGVGWASLLQGSG